ncbi:MAG: WD40 repeat domain-containing protein, partial [Actinomycetota bacterium]
QNLPVTSTHPLALRVAPGTVVYQLMKKSRPYSLLLVVAATALPLAAAPLAPPRPAVKLPVRKPTDVVVPLATSIPAELVPVKAGTTTKVSPANLQAVLKAGPLSPVTAICFSPDGKRLFAATYGRVAVWDLEQGRVSGYLPGIAGAVHDLELSPDGKRLAVGGGEPSQSGTVLLYDAQAPAQPLTKLAGHSDVVYALAWSADGKRLATASFDKTVKVWDFPAGTATLTLKDHTDAVLAVAFSPDGAILASGGRDHSIKLFDAATGKSLRTLTGHDQDVQALAISADGKCVISSGREPGLRWWDLATGKQLRNQGGHGSSVFEVRRSADGKQLLSVSQDQTVRLWDGVSGGHQKAFSSGGDPLFCASLSPDGKRVAAGSWSGLLRLWDAPSGRLLVLGLALPDLATRPEWLLATPEGYLNASDAAPAVMQWKVGGETVAAEPFSTALLKPAEVLKALRGEAVSPVKLQAPK